MGNPGQPAPALCAVRLFDQQYVVNITSAVATQTVTFSDMIAGSSAAVYRLGCAIPPLPMAEDEGPNLVFDGANARLTPCCTQ